MTSRLVTGAGSLDPSLRTPGRTGAVNPLTPACFPGCFRAETRWKHFISLPTLNGAAQPDGRPQKRFNLI
ncbi:hypothetical protein PBY51_019667 [Eleginops maclovinus]|uniref:Uncharacterized protein n=1 Tax=Eleginops maclovinus TaxID=56733 RepID=A0AAN8AJY4_ELEMC|nr:hypothetical protein PBY51_019667 [Eleginops maclovinus]